MSDTADQTSSQPNKQAHGSGDDENVMVQARKAFTGCIATQPLLVFAGGFVLMLLFVALSFTPGLLDTGDSEADSPGQLFALNEPAVAQAQVLSAIIEDSNEAAVSSQPTLSQAEYLNWFIMTSKSDNFFTAATMQELYAYQQALGPSSFPYDEDQIENPPSFRGQTIDDFPDYCHKPTYLDGRCASFYSPLEVIVFQGEPFTSADVANLTDALVEQRLREAYENEWPGGSDFFVSAEFFEGVEQSPPVYRVKYSQFYLFFGGPLPDYNTVLDKEDEQQQEVQEWSTQYIDFLQDASPRTFKANYYSDGFSSVEIGRLVQGDLLLTAAAGVSVALVVGMQTGSTIIAIVGVLGVAWSYPCALAIYHGILGIKISPQLNLLAIFIILGIGADDIFVMLDAWKQSEHEPESEVGPKGDEGLPQRVDWVWSRAANAMFVTSLTTAVAFGVTSASPIPAIASFGTLSSLMVLAVYCHTITTFAAFVVLWHLWGMEKQCCCRSKLPDEYCGNNCCGLSCWNTYAQQRRIDEEALKPGSEASQSLKDAAKARKEAHEAAARRRDEGVDVWAPEPLQSQASKKLPAAAVAQAGCSGASAPGQAPGGDGDDTSTATHRAVDISSFRTIEQFFYKYWAPFTYNFRFPLLGLFLCLLVLSAVGAAYLEGPDKQEVGLPEESQIYQIVEILQPKFRPSESQGSGAEVNGIWGVDPGRPLDRSGIDPNDENNVGSVRYDQDFNPTSVAAQEHLAQVCQDLVGLRFNPADDSSPYFLAGGIGMFCPVQMFVEWQREQFGAVQAYTDKVQMASMMWNFSQTYQDPNYNASDPVSVATVSQFPVKDLVGEFFGGVTGQADDELLFIRSRFNLSLSFNPGRVEQQKHFDAWTEHFDEINEQAEEGYNKGFTSSFFFAFLQTSNVMVQATWQAVGASVAVAAVCLLVASGNWRVALVALVMVASIVLGILGMFVALGRKLDFVESISASVLVGLSVDYSTHIIISYATSRAKGTFFRTRYALLELGVSIVGGASTSLISSSFLFGAALPFFTIFGSTLFLSLLIAFLYTMLFLPPMLIVFGPEQYPDGDFYVFLSDMLFGTDLVEQAHKQRRAAEMELASSSGKSRQLEEGGPASGGNDEKSSQNPASEV